MALRVRLDEIVPSKEAARTLPTLLERLEGGELERVVITRRSQPRAVLITLEQYEQLLEEEPPAEAPQRRVA
jgi:prevent-host-death family protein